MHGRDVAGLAGMSAIMVVQSWNATIFAPILYALSKVMLIGIAN
jgi:hypothetical protein